MSAAEIARLDRKLKGILLTIIAACLMGGFTYGVRETTIGARLSRIEAWMDERKQPIEDYYKFREEVSSRLATIEAVQNSIDDRLKDIQARLGSKQ